MVARIERPTKPSMQIRPTIFLLLLTIWMAGCDESSLRTEIGAEIGAEIGTAIENVTVIDPVNGPAEAQRVVVVDGIIASVGPMSEPVPQVASVRDGSGRYLIPGLWDMHVHFLYDEGLTDVMPGLFLDHGITSVRDTGGNLERLAALRDTLASSSEPSPSIYFSGPLLDGRFVVYDGGDPGRPALGTGIPDAQTARAYVRRLKEAGADFIKIYELVDPSVYEVLAAVAREAGLPIASHVPLMMTADAAGPLADSMEHLRNLELACAANWQELLETRRVEIGGFIEGRGYDLRRSLHALQRLPAIEAYDEARCDSVLAALTTTIQVPTLRLNTVATNLPFDHPNWSDTLLAFPRSVQERWRTNADQIRAAEPLADRTFSEWSMFLISRLQANGVPIGAGTDTPIGLGIPGWSLHTELELLVRAGLTPSEALHAATVQAARFLKLEDRIGRIQPGMQADLVLLDANPLTDIGNTRTISGVMLKGDWVR